MANKLTPCPDCGHQISKQAKACPNCGGKPKRRTTATTWVITGLIAFILIGSALSPIEPTTDAPSSPAASTHPAPTKQTLAGNLTEQDICNTAGLLIRRSLSNAYRTIDIPCSVTADNNQVSINAGYRVPQPMGGHTLRYTATGQVTGRNLRINTIRVHGVDDQPVDFAEFGF
ncbi:MAG: hypothetical protein VBE63_15280 [Lamprobacter sp.]|uniref:hypothetical protein n=1 Tax=Lamprobacter sp. TaxID=3100796 RepID=UPI002B262EF9|nr:hypothetical protein [Lamprobacter sp.]MEA3641286.1 hypothetical protein [Lamprobacter sp.]